MGKNIDLKEKFQEYFNQNEGSGIRSDRFYEEFASGMMREKRISQWLEAAFIAGARDMAQDTLDTLGDYACACAGLEKESIKPEEVYDRAHSNLMTYYTQVLDDAESKYSDIVSDGGMDPRDNKSTK